MLRVPDAAHGGIAYFNTAVAIVYALRVESVFKSRGCHDGLEYRTRVVGGYRPVNQRGTGIVEHGGNVVPIVCGNACHGKYFSRVNIYDDNCPAFDMLCGRRLGYILDIAVDCQHDAAVGDVCGVVYFSVRAVKTSAGRAYPACH